MGTRDYPDRTAFTVAEWTCGAADRLDPARVPRSFAGVRRGALASRSEDLRCLLQRNQAAFVTGQESAGVSATALSSAPRGYPNSRRAPSSIRQGLGFG
jgi:hypothetical protein